MTDDISQVLKSHHVSTPTYLGPLPKPASEDDLAAVLAPGGHSIEEPTSADTAEPAHRPRHKHTANEMPILWTACGFKLAQLT